MNDRTKKVAMSHLMSPQYKGDLLEFFENSQENEIKRIAHLTKIVQAVRPWYQTLEAVKKTLDHFIRSSDYNLERRGGNFYFHPKQDSFHESKSYPMIFVNPKGDTFLSDASHREREHEEKASKLETPQHQPPMGAQKYNMSSGIKAIIDKLSSKKENKRYQ